MFKFWKKYGFEIVLGLAVLFFFFYWLFFRRGKQGTYSSTYQNLRIPKLASRGPPQTSKGEKICKAVLERFFNKPFYKVRPDWLKNGKTGRNLELDLYNPELALAVEVQGEAHYHYNRLFHKTYQSFLDQRYRDNLKRLKCKQHGVILVEVPYIVPPEQIETFLRIELKKVGITV